MTALLQGIGVCVSNGIAFGLNISKPIVILTMAYINKDPIDLILIESSSINNSQGNKAIYVNLLHF